MIKRAMIDCYLLIVFALLFFKSYTGQHQHEALGLILMVLMIIHLILYWHRMYSMGRLNNRYSVGTAICIVLTILSGIIPSELLSEFIAVNSGLSSELRNWHPYLAYLSLVAILGHIMSKRKVIWGRLIYIIRH